MFEADQTILHYLEVFLKCMYNMQVSGIKKLMKLAKKKANHTVLHLLRPLRQRLRPSRASTSLILNVRCL